MNLPTYHRTDLYGGNTKAERGKSINVEQNTTSIGGVHRTNRIKRLDEERERIEELFMRQAERANRSDKQRQERRNKR